MARSFLQRLLFTAPTPPSASTELVAPKRLLSEDVVKNGPPADTKASSYALLPSGAYGPNYSFFSPDGGNTFYDLTNETGQTITAFVAYWYIATRWRAQKLAEAPLMVVEEDQETGDEEWINDHELVDVLDAPSEDYDMGELIECTSQYLDNTGAALWVLDRDRAERIGRITPFSKHEFEIVPSDTRMYAQFRIQTKDGTKTKDAEECCFFRDSHGITRWGVGRSRLDVAMSWLRLGAKAQQTVHDLLGNSIWPSLVVSPNHEWNPGDKELEQYKQEIAQYGRAGAKGQPFIALGGATVQQLAARINELVPTDILNRVESVISAVSGVPAIVLQFEVGLQNSPWSQMAQARRMAYDDTVVPTWRKMERVMTRQMLRIVDEDPTHFVRFDKTNIDALQADQLEAVQIATSMGRAATLNERRGIMGLEPATKEQDPDGKADEIPELTTPSLEELLAGGAAEENDDEEGDEEDDEKKPPTPEDAEKEKEKKARRLWLERKFKTASLSSALRNEAIPSWQMTVHRLLQRDADEISTIVEQTLIDAEESKALSTKARRGKDRVMQGVDAYFKAEHKKAWERGARPLMVQASERSTAVIAADLNASFRTLHPHILRFAEKQTGRLISKTTKTTRGLVSDIIQGGIDEGKSTRQIAGLIRDATGFSMSRAKMIARTETTIAFNGAPQESLAAFGQDSGRKFTKTWSGMLDDVERDEHVAMEGETVAIDKAFSNGLMYPSEPNCRCTTLYDEEEED